MAKFYKTITIEVEVPVSQITQQTQWPTVKSNRAVVVRHSKVIPLGELAGEISHLVQKTEED